MDSIFTLFILSLLRTWNKRTVQPDPFVELDYDVNVFIQPKQEDFIQIEHKKKQLLKKQLCIWTFRERVMETCHP